MHKPAVIERAVAFLIERGVSADDAQPLLYQWLWHAGIAIPPPHFINSLARFLFHAAFMSAFWGVFMWILTGWWLHYAAQSLVTASLGFGIAMSAVGVTVFHFTTRKFNIPSWTLFVQGG
jgi:hypothetical protein